MAEKKIKLKSSEDDPGVAYLQLPDHPGEGTHGVVVKQVNLAEVIQGYKGPDIYLDFSKGGILIGIEILT